MTEGIALRDTNIKSMAGGSIPVGYLHAGDKVYGTLTLTDMINFDHFYKNITNERVELNQMCKAYRFNLKISDTPEPTTPPPDPDPIPEQDELIWNKSTDGGVTWKYYKTLVVKKDA